jgi:uncharacterized SAM-dependent methyltransferase
MHLDCLRSHRTLVAGEEIRFIAGESIHSENSYKYRPEEFRKLAGEAGLEPVHCWLDDKEWFSVHYFRCR